MRLRAALPGVEVRLAYAGVARPQLADVLPGLDGPVVVVPAFLAAGFHVRVDVPGQLAAIGREDVTLADPFGPDPALVDVALDRLREAGWRDEQVVLAAAGSTDPVAQEDLRTAAGLFADRLGTAVPVGYIAGGDAAGGGRGRGAGRAGRAAHVAARARRVPPVARRCGRRRGGRSAG